MKVLNRIDVAKNCFDDIVVNESDTKVNDKKVLMEKTIEKYGVKAEDVLSIGDRYDVDGRPIIELGGQTVIIKSPLSIKKVIEDFNNFKTCDEYQYFD